MHPVSGQGGGQNSARVDHLIRSQISINLEPPIKREPFTAIPAKTQRMSELSYANAYYQSPRVTLHTSPSRMIFPATSSSLVMISARFKQINVVLESLVD